MELNKTSSTPRAISVNDLAIDKVAKIPFLEIWLMTVVDFWSWEILELRKAW